MAEIELQVIKNSDSRLRANMANHYSQPKGFVGRNICYAILFGGVYYGGIVAGSATLHLACRDVFFNLNGNKALILGRIINNTFFHLEKINGRYPLRWQFARKVLSAFREISVVDWECKYGERVIGFESLVELPRAGTVYLQDGWQEVGQTIGYTCKRGAGKGTDSWSGKRVWDTKNLRPKRVFCRAV